MLEEVNRIQSRFLRSDAVSRKRRAPASWRPVMVVEEDLKPRHDRLSQCAMLNASESGNVQFKQSPILTVGVWPIGLCTCHERLLLSAALHVQRSRRAHMPWSSRVPFLLLNSIESILYIYKTCVSGSVQSLLLRAPTRCAAVARACIHDIGPEAQIPSGRVWPKMV